MTITLEEEVRKLHEDGLHSNVRQLVSLMLSLPEFTPPLKEEYQIYAKKYQLLVYYGLALYHEECYKRAEVQFNEALKLRKMLAKVKSKSTQASRQAGLTTELDVKYHIYQCHMKQEDYKQALAVLEGIAPKQRTLKVNMMLGKLYQKHGMERSAITCFKEVLRSSPVALDAAKCLLNLGVSVHEVSALISAVGSTNSSTIPEWVAQYLKGNSFAASNRHSKAVLVYRGLELQDLKNNVSLLCSLGNSYYRCGDKQNAINCYEKVRMLDKLCLEGMDIFAQILAEENHKEQLQKLAEELAEISKNKTEPWVVLSHYCSSNEDNARAVHFAQKAHVLDTTNVPALIAKASQLQILNKIQEAVIHYREAIRLAPNQLESYEGLVECHISSEKYKEAMNIARNAHKTIGANARTLTLCAKVCACEPQTHAKAKAMLNKGLTMDPLYLPAVYMLARILMKEEEFEAASTLLTKQLDIQKTAELYCLNGECLKELGDSQMGIIQYGKALRIDPENKKAIQGLQSVERDISDLDVSGIGVQDSRDRSSIEELHTVGTDIQWID